MQTLTPQIWCESASGPVMHSADAALACTLPVMHFTDAAPGMPHSLSCTLQILHTLCHAPCRYCTLSVMYLADAGQACTLPVMHLTDAALACTILCMHNWCIKLGSALYMTARPVPVLAHQIYVKRYSRKLFSTCGQSVVH